ncbi:MAG TPA: serine/threonine-protein kinase, partial [Candidatus Melainabacteria bacterium]|nr:serine/threonine-protein kinase [Candidatus Melainabacteria bacterium]
MSEEKTVHKLDATKQLAPAGNLSNDAFLELEPGSILLDKYKVVALLGRGGMGSVYCVEHLQLQKKFALKFLNKHQSDEAAWIRFETEARAANKLDHPNLVKVVDSGLLEEGQPYFIMDLIVGESLSDLLKAAGRLPLEKALKIFIQVGFALSYAHSNGVIHRDIKPSNIMICSTDTADAHGILVKLVDFGIAKLTGHDEFNQQTLTKTGEIFG